MRLSCPWIYLEMTRWLIYVLCHPQCLPRHSTIVAGVSTCSSAPQPRKRLCFSEHQLWQAHLPLVALFAWIPPEGSFKGSQCQTSTYMGYFLFVSPWIIVLMPGVCLARPQACLKLQTALYSLVLVYGNHSDLLPAAFFSPKLTDAWPGEVGQGGKGGGLQKCDCSTWL